MAGFWIPGPSVDMNVPLDTTRHQFDNDMIRHLFDEDKLENADLGANVEALNSTTNANPADQARKVRKVIHMYLLRAESLRFYAKKGWEEEVEQAYEGAGDLCRRKIRKFQKNKFLYGEAAMLCCLVELDLEKNEFCNAKLKEYKEPLRRALDAQKTAREAGDKELEAVALMLAAKIYRKEESTPTSWKFGDGNHTKTLEVLRDARNLLESNADDVGLAKALLMYGSVQCFRNEMEEGISVLFDAQERFRLAGKRSYEALVMLHLAELYISKRQARKAMPLAEDALQLLQSITPRSKYLARAVTAFIRALYQKGDEKKALQKADELIDYFRDSGETRQHITTLVTMAEALHFYEEDEADKVMEEAIEECAAFPDKRLILDVLLKGCDLLSGREGKFAQREQWLAEALEVSNEIDDVFRKMRVMQKKKSLYLDQYWFTDAQSAAEELVQLTKELRVHYEEIGERSMAAHAVTDHAAFIASTSDFQRALVLAQQGLDLFVQAEDKEGEARSLSLMAEITSDIAERDSNPTEKDNAMSYVKKMRQCAKAVRSASLEAKSMALKHNICKTHSEFSLAAQAAAEAVACIRRTHDKDSILTYLLMSCDAYLDKANWDDRDGGAARALQFATRMGKEALNIARVMRRKSVIGMALLQMADVLTSSGKLEEAMDYAKEALTLFRQIKQVPGEALSIAHIAIIHYHNGKEQEALGAAREVIEMASTARHQRDLLEDAIYMADSVADLISDTRKGSRDVHRDRDFSSARYAASQDSEDSKEASFQAELDTRLIYTTVLDMAKSTIGLEAIAYDSPLSQSGMDSLTAVSFRNGLQQSLGVRLSANLIDENPTVREIAALAKIKLERGHTS